MDVEPAVKAAKAITGADDAVVLNHSNKVVLRLLPGETLARVAPAGEHNFARELELGRRLPSAVTPLDSVVHELDGVAVSLWQYYEPLGEVPPEEYGAALHRLHAEMRDTDVPVPHFTDRIREALAIVTDRSRPPYSTEADRDLLITTLQRPLRPAPEQLLHGEPHPGNLLNTKDGPLFIDLETVCRGPVEFDLAHAPDEAAAHYPGIDHELLHQCRLLMLAIVVSWRWDPHDQLPNGRQQAADFTARLRAAG